MNSYFYSLLLVFIIVAWLINEDPNVGTWIDIKIQQLWLEIRRSYYLIAYHPKNFITTWRLNRKLDKLLKEYEDEMKDD